MQVARFLSASQLTNTFGGSLGLFGPHCNVDTNSGFFESPRVHFWQWGFSESRLRNLDWTAELTPCCISVSQWPLLGSLRTSGSSRTQAADE